MKALALALALASPAPDFAANESLDAATPSPHEGEAVRIAAAMYRQILIPASVEHGKPRAWAYCRKAPGGCRARLEAFADLMVAACAVNGCDPWTLAAQAMRESRVNPDAEGPGGERGILQIHPRRREVRESQMLGAWFRDPKYRNACLSERVDACQGAIVWTAAEIMGRSLRRCLASGASDVEACALSFYNTGRPDTGAGLRYARAVRKWRKRLKASDGF